MATLPILPLIKNMKKDQRYKRLRDTFDRMPMYQLATEDLMTEIMTLHQMREIRRLNSQSPGFVDAVVRANTGDQAIRSRLTEIIMTCVAATNSLEDAVSALKYHLLQAFSDDLKSFRTKDERSQVVERVLVPFTKYIGKIATLKEVAALATKDIDQGAWSLKTSIQAVELHTQRESRV